MKDVFLIKLTNCGDTFYGLVDQETWDWINSPIPDFGKADYLKETLPPSIDARFSKVPLAYGKEYKGVTISKKNPVNDRAQAALGIAIGADEELYFDTVKEINTYLKENDLHLADEYKGYYL